MATKFGLRKPQKTVVVLPVGRYEAKIEEVKARPDSTKGSVSMNFTFRIDNDGAKYHGTYINAYPKVENKSEKAVNFGTNQVCAIAEAAGLELKDEPEEEFDTADQYGKHLNSVLAGKRLIIQLGAPDEGFTRNTCKDFFAL